MNQSNQSPAQHSHFISLEKAVAMTSRYRNNKEQILATTYQDSDILALNESFDRAAIDTLLATPGCAGMRIYYGMDTALKVHAVMVAVNADNEDILPAGTETASNSAEDDPIIVEEGQRCPPICPGGSPLNEQP